MNPLKAAPRPGLVGEWQVVPALALVLAVLYRFVTPHMWAASLAYACMVAGLAFRRRSRRAHAWLMGSAMGLDLALVATLEIQRDAVATALRFSLGPWQQAHIAVSLAAVLLYAPVLGLGLRRYLNPDSASGIRHWHMRLGILAFAFRSLGFLLMFSMLGARPGE